MPVIAARSGAQALKGASLPSVGLSELAKLVLPTRAAAALERLRKRWEIIDDEDEETLAELAHSEAARERTPEGRRGIFSDPEEMKERVRLALLRRPYNVMKYYKKTGWAQRIARTAIFENLTLLIISINAIWIAVDVDLNHADSLLEAETEFVVAENCFCSYFAIELLIRYVAFRRSVYAIRDRWFVFDAILVCLMVWETWAMTLILRFSGSGRLVGLKNASILRLFRLVRLARMARMLRSVPELMILIRAIMAALRSVFFVLCLMIFALYCFSIALAQMTQQTATVGKDYFPDVVSGMGTLATYGLFLNSFGLIFDDLAAESPLGLVTLGLFVLLGSLTLMNMLVGVLCEVITVAAASEKEEMTVSFVRKRIKDILSTLDKSSEDVISKAEFMYLLQNPSCAQGLEEVGVDPIGIVDFAAYIFQSCGNQEEDTPANPVKEGQQSISFDKFMTTMLKLRGSNLATVKDIVDLRRFVLDVLRDIELAVTHAEKSKIGTSLRTRRSKKAVKLGKVAIKDTLSDPDTDAPDVTSMDTEISPEDLAQAAPAQSLVAPDTTAPKAASTAGSTAASCEDVQTAMPWGDAVKPDGPAVEGSRASSRSWSDGCLGAETTAQVGASTTVIADSATSQSSPRSLSKHVLGPAAAEPAPAPVVPAPTGPRSPRTAPAHVSFTGEAIGVDCAPAGRWTKPQRFEDVLSRLDGRASSIEEMLVELLAEVKAGQEVSQRLRDSQETLRPPSTPSQVSV